MGCTWGQDYGRVESEVESVLARNPGFHVTKGNKVLEIRPCIGWNKGDALKYLLDTLGFHNSTSSNHVFPIYIGDDTTDEDAFKVFIYILYEIEIEIVKLACIN